MRFIKTYAWAFWLGASLAFAGIHITEITYWVIFVPVAILVDIAKNTK